MKRRHVACVVVMSLVAIIMGSGIAVGDDCWDDFEPRINIAAHYAYLIEGELQPRQPVAKFIIEGIDLSAYVADGARPVEELTTEELLELKRIADESGPPQRQVLVEAEMMEVSQGIQREIGYAGLSKGAVITTNFANGASNQQVITFSMLSQPNQPTIDMLRYSYRNGVWQTVSIAGLFEENKDEVKAPGILEVPFLPHLFKVQQPDPGNLIVLVTPAIVDENGMTRRPPAAAQNGAGDSPRTDIHTPPPGSPSDSRRTDFITPPGKVSLIGGERRRGGDWTVSINPETGFVVMSPPRVGVGTRIIGPDEIYALKSPEWINGFTVGGRVDVPLSALRGGSGTDADLGGPIIGRHRPYFFFGGNYTDLSGDESSVVEPGTDPSAITFPELTSPSDFTGIGLGVAGLESMMDVDFEEWQIFGGGGFGFDVCGCSCTDLSFEPWFGFGESNIDYNSELRVVTLPDNFVRLNQNVDSFIADFALRTTVTHRLNRKFALYGSATVGGYYYDADGHSRTDVNFPVLAPPDDFFVSDQSASEDGIGFKGGIEGGIRYRIMHGTTLHAGVGFEYLSHQVYWKNPPNPAEPAASLDTDDALNVYGRFGVRFTF